MGSVASDLRTRAPDLRREVGGVTEGRGRVTKHDIQLKSDIRRWGPGLGKEILRALGTSGSPAVKTRLAGLCSGSMVRHLPPGDTVQSWSGKITCLRRATKPVSTATELWHLLSLPKHAPGARAAARSPHTPGLRLPLFKIESLHTATKPAQPD